MDAPQGLEVFIVETLDAERQAIHAGGAEAGEFRGFDGAGVGLKSDFGIRRQHRQCPEGGDQLVDGSRREQAGRAAAEEDADHRPSPDQGQGGLQVGDQGVDVVAFGNRPVRFMRIEVAVRALLDAPRHMDIKRQRRGDAELEAGGRRRRLGCGKNRDGARHDQRVGRRSISRCMAWPRCDTRFLVSGSSSAAVRPKAGTLNSGS